ncbi:MAG: EamA family transporter RarD [Mycobacteriales bacterium]
MTESRRGLLLGTAAYVLWGLFPVYWPLVKPAGAVEILAHRVIWSLVAIAVIGVLTRNSRRVRDLVADRRRGALLAVAACVVAVNWGVYIYGVNHHHVVETSLGYFINPLVTVLLGVFVLHESLRRAQWMAVGIGAVAVAVLAVEYGRLPWIALALAFSFGTYGLIKKHVNAGAPESLTVETGVLVVPAAVYLAILGGQGHSTFGHHGAGQALFLAGSGLVTAGPLLCFAGAATRLPLTTLGLLQYLAPVLQFAFGVLFFHEPMPIGRLIGFMLVWIALIVLTVDGLRHRTVVARLARAEILATDVR